MFSGIETKLKTLAKAMAVFGVLAAIAGAVLLYLSVGGAEVAVYATPCTILIAGGLVLYFGSFFAYGLGQLIENTAGGTAAAPSASTQTVVSSAPATAPAAAPASNASADEATIVAIATAAIAASRGASACAFKVISVTKIS